MTNSTVVAKQENNQDNVLNKVTGVSIVLNGGEEYKSTNIRCPEMEDMCNRIMMLGEG